MFGFADDVAPADEAIEREQVAQDIDRLLGNNFEDFTGDGYDHTF